MALKPCLTCGTPTRGSHCARHARPGSTRSWRTLRTLILERDGHRCQLCARPAEHVDHITPVIRGGTDHPNNLRATCARCNLTRGEM